MGISGDGDRGRGSFGRGFIWILVLSILLCWLPLFGPLVAGVVGGRKARGPFAAFLAGLIPALLWLGFLTWLSQKELRIGSQVVMAGPFYFYGWMAASCLLGGALMGADPFAARLLGALVLAAGFWYFLPHANDMRTSLAPFVSAFTSSRAAAPNPETTASCEQNLSKLYTALQFYMDDWGGQLPPAASWMTQIKDAVPDSALHCPAVGSSGPKYGYSMNPALGGKRLESMKNRASTPLLYDSTDLADSAHAGVSSLPRPGRHGGKDSVLYADGTVKAIEPP